jgi:hypothetical protein
MKRFVLSMIGVLALATSALALDASSWTAKVERFATSDGTIRGLCICKQAGIYYLKAGFLTSGSSSVPSSTMTGVGISCAVPLFYAGGGTAQIGSCYSFEVLGKK